MACKFVKSLKLCNIHKISNYIEHIQQDINTKYFSSTSNKEILSPSFGLIFDIDGVLVRGKQVLPGVQDTFMNKLTNSGGRFVVPTVFVTNAGNSLAADKAKQLTEWLGVEVEEDQVVMSHTPIKMLHKYHTKHTLISGQGPMEEIAKRLGFNKVVTVDSIRNAHPLLDCVDHRRRVSLKDVQSGKVVPSPIDPVEAIAVIGEPVRWETNLQLIIDLLLTNGNPNELPPTVPYPHIPVIASNMDLLWMSEATMPRFGHGTFLVCLESLYKKITGHDLIYDHLVGKPCELTYQYAVQLLLKQVSQPQQLIRLYGIG
ncbi:haloacid dehalogenase-like hydrolase domain-containing 5 [Diaphorina citri]|uniref:Haloacid dehalogenase-like hydrolase domain-containing 5 n=1 Tax=Diaphorina citri TaxID=121845 RepID=A0A1S3DH60_DIACI|nr:haloacid dehalogenase-like hydrolase domain-containing 5 [Diaphorina citri]